MAEVKFSVQLCGLLSYTNTNTNFTDKMAQVKFSFQLCGLLSYTDTNTNTNTNTNYTDKMAQVEFSVQLCGLLSYTGNYEFLAKGSVITDLKQSIWGKVCLQGEQVVQNHICR